MQNVINEGNAFEFVKFIPVYVNDFAITDDTVLNINYNVNITGDKNNYNKNLTVHGDINTNELNANVINAKEINNIYTNDIIVSTAGLNIGETSNTDTTPTFIVNTTGNLKCNDITANDITANSSKIVCEDDTSKMLSTSFMNKNLYINTSGKNIFLSFKPQPNITDEVLEDYDVDNVGSIIPFEMYSNINYYKQSNSLRPYAGMWMNAPSMQIYSDESISLMRDDFANVYASSSSDLLDICQQYDFGGKKYKSLYRSNTTNITTSPKITNTVSAVSGEKSIGIGVSQPLCSITVPLTESSSNDINNYNLYGLQYNSTEKKYEKLTDYEYSAGKISIDISQTYGIFIGVYGKPISTSAGYKWPKMKSTSNLLIKYNVYYFKGENTTENPDAHLIYNTSSKYFPKDFNWVGHSSNGTAWPSSPTPGNGNGYLDRWEKFYFTISKIEIGGADYDDLLNELTKLTNVTKHKNDRLVISVSFAMNIDVLAANDDVVGNSISKLYLRGIRRLPYNRSSLGIITRQTTWDSYTVDNYNSNTDSYITTSYPIERYSYLGCISGQDGTNTTTSPKLGLYHSGIVFTDQSNTLISIALDESTNEYNLISRTPAGHIQIPIKNLISAATANTSLATYGV